MSPADAGSAGGIFVTGTDTGVGKTFVACSLARNWRALGIDVAPRKPVESGCVLRGAELHPADAALLAAAAGVAPERLDEVTRFRLAEPLAPDLAARLAGRPLYLDELIDACARPAGTWRITEGAGGLYSPLCEDGLNADLAEALGDPVVLVAEDRLGTLSQCLLALEALDRRRLRIAAVVLNRRRADAHPAMDNRTALSGRTDAPVFTFAEGVPPADLDQSLSTWSSSIVRPPDPGSIGAGS
ncbi:dethiobiotin synthase [Thioalkalivibrio paradoxus]|uniref:ATP-dependent dethiobiotin synthetase BioD n=1 Tax=Thioalkalivibrio paradoxus ARh 1 TaxID=713585 RepID=W0DRN9_9GAMM|nr:dethiobiotin synthase [Thioalkalivibrio paradoxus]AHE99525.1 dethiobiotin synthase [Thioalkalivibrio paradoxus ARh 1]